MTRTGPPDFRVAFLLTHSRHSQQNKHTNRWSRLLILRDWFARTHKWMICQWTLKQLLVCVSLSYCLGTRCRWPRWPVLLVRPHHEEYNAVQGLLVSNRRGILLIPAVVVLLFLPTAGLVHHGGGNHRDRGALLRLCECDAQCWRCCFLSNHKVSNDAFLKIVYKELNTFSNWCIFWDSEIVMKIKEEEEVELLAFFHCLVPSDSAGVSVSLSRRSHGFPFSGTAAPDILSLTNDD